MAKRKSKVPVVRNPLHQTLAARPNGSMVKTKKALRRQEKQKFRKQVKNGKYDDCRYVGLDHRDIQYFRNHLAIQTR